MQRTTRDTRGLMYATTATAPPTAASNESTG